MIDSTCHSNSFSFKKQTINDQISYGKKICKKLKHRFLKLKKKKKNFQNEKRYHDFKERLLKKRNFTNGKIDSKNLHNCIDFINQIPDDVRWHIITYLHPKEIRESIMYVNKTWYQVLNSEDLWNRCKDIYGIYSTIVLNPKPLSERRSKGKIRKGRIIGKGDCVCIRTVHLETTNAGNDDGIPTSFLRECALLQQINHPNVVKYYGCEVEDEKLRIITEYLPFNLRQFWQELRLRGQNTNKKKLKKITIYILKQILQGLNFLHHNGIFHRNLKPENIFIQEDILEYSKNEDSNHSQKYRKNLNSKNKIHSHDNQIRKAKRYIVKIGDLCMGRLCDVEAKDYTPEDPKDRERSWREARRLYYKAPEMILRKLCYGLEVDMWSVGVILLEMVLSRPPFFADNEISYLMEVFKMLGRPSDDILIDLSDSPSIWLDNLPKWKCISIDAVNYLILNDYCRDSQIHSYFTQVYDESGQVESFALLYDFTHIMGVRMLRLLMRFLVLPGRMRISAAEALEQYFQRIEKNLTSNHRNQEDDIHTVNGTFKSYENKKNINMCPKPKDFDVVKRIKIMENNVSRESKDWFFFQKSSASCRSITTTGNNISDRRMMELNSKKKNIIWARAETINWLFVVQPEFSLKSQTVHLAVDYFHRYINFAFFDQSKIPELEEIKLCALTCLKIADVYNEKSQEYYKSDNATEYSDLTGHEIEIEEGVVDVVNRQISADQILKHEKGILNILKFNLVAPTITWHLEANMQLINLDKSSRCFDFAYMIADISLYDNLLYSYSPLLKSQVILLLSVWTYLGQFEAKFNFENEPELCDLHATVNKSGIIDDNYVANMVPREKFRDDTIKRKMNSSDSCDYGCEGKLKYNREKSQKNIETVSKDILRAKRVLKNFLKHRQELCECNFIWMSANCVKRFELLVNRARPMMQMNSSLNSALTNHLSEEKFTLSIPRIPAELLNFILPYRERDKLKSYGWTSIMTNSGPEDHGFIEMLLESKKNSS